jgi:hypothetical protein
MIPLRKQQGCCLRCMKYAKGKCIITNERCGDRACPNMKNSKDLPIRSLCMYCKRFELDQRARNADHDLKRSWVGLEEIG